MRALHVIQALGVGGAERVAVALARALAARGDEVAVCAADGPLAAELPPATARYELPLVERRVSRLPAAVFAVARAVRSFEPEVVHAHNPAVAFAAGVATLRGRRVPGLASVHGVPDADYAAAARLLRLAGLRVVACGPAIAAGLAEAGLQTETITNGIAPAPPPAERAALEHELGVPPGRPLLVWVGRLRPPKDPVLAVRALAGVPDATLLIVGEGPLRRDVERRCSRGGRRRARRPRRRAHGRPRADRRRRRRPPGLILGGAAACGARGAGRRNTARRDRSPRGAGAAAARGDGAARTSGDVEALAAAARRLLDDAELARSLSARGLEEAGRHTEDAMVEAYFRSYGALQR